MSGSVTQIDITNYTGKIPFPNSNQPTFLSWVAALCEPLLALTNFAANSQTYYDLDTAVGKQLDIIGIFVGISRYVEVPISGVFFSWGIAGVGWGEGVWLGDYTPSESINMLDDFHYRFLLRYKIARNNWNGTNETLPAAYSVLFADTPVVFLIQDNLDMTMTITVQNSAALSAVQLALINGGYVNINPMGVSLTWSLE